jgi:hypothetical protein
MKSNRVHSRCEVVVEDASDYEEDGIFSTSKKPRGNPQFAGIVQENELFRDGSYSIKAEKIIDGSVNLRNQHDKSVSGDIDRTSSQQPVKQASSSMPSSSSSSMSSSLPSHNNQIETETRHVLYSDVEAIHYDDEGGIPFCIVLALEKPLYFYDNNIRCNNTMMNDLNLFVNDFIKREMYKQRQAAHDEQHPKENTTTNDRKTVVVYKKQERLDFLSENYWQRSDMRWYLQGTALLAKILFSAVKSNNQNTGLAADAVVDSIISNMFSNMIKKQSWEVQDSTLIQLVTKAIATQGIDNSKVLDAKDIFFILYSDLESKLS